VEKEIKKIEDWSTIERVWCPQCGYEININKMKNTIFNLVDKVIKRKIKKWKKK